MKRASLLITACCLAVCNVSHSQKKLLRSDHSLAIPALHFAPNGDLQMTPSATSSATDFDFLIGKWRLQHEKLKTRLAKNNEWIELETTVEDFKILEGVGNMDVARATFDGKPWEGRTLRIFNEKTRLWSLYWVASNVGALDPPVVGSFENGVGHFFGKDTFNGKPIIMLFRWDARDKEHPIWSQAFSPDNGKTWEWNWYNVSNRVK